MVKGLSFDPERRQERFESQLSASNRGIRSGDLVSRLRQAEAFSNGNVDGYAPQDPKEIMADVLSFLRYAGVRW